MEALTCQPRAGLFGSIDHISQQRVADVGQMDPDLVGSSGLQAALNMGIPRKTGENGPVGDRLPSLQEVDRHPLSICPVAGDGGVDRARVLSQIANAYRLILPVQAVILKLLRQSEVGEIVFGGDKKAGGIPVDAVNNTGAEGSVDSGERFFAVI